jgi:hypothetical protein
MRKGKKSNAVVEFAPCQKKVDSRDATIDIKVRPGLLEASFT